MTGGDEASLAWPLRIDEHAMLVVLLRELDEAIDGPTDDPVVQRLFPTAVDGDDEQDQQLRTLIASELLLQRHETIAHLLAVLEATELPPGDSPWHDEADDASSIHPDELDPTALPIVVVELAGDEPRMMLSTINDVRLAIAQRVGLTAVELPQLVADDDPRRGLLDLMDHLAHLQMGLLAAIDPSSVARLHDEDDGD